jgi:hypothetical protein
LFFLKGYGHAFAVADEYSFSCLHLQVPPGKTSAEFGRSQKQDILLQCAILSENDDDDDDSGPARKKSSISRFSALNTVFFLSDVSHSPHSRQRSYEFVGCLSYDRCIFQRVLKV